MLCHSWAPVLQSADFSLCVEQGAVYSGDMDFTITQKTKEQSKLHIIVLTEFPLCKHLQRQHANTNNPGQ